MEHLSLFVLLLYALYEGLVHAFEADHILAVTNIVSQRNKIFPALKDGIFWGLGHTSTIFLVGIIMILFKVNISDSSFSYFEAIVGLMLILVASYRLYLFFREKRNIIVHTHPHEHAGENKHPHLHVHFSKNSHADNDGKNLHKASYGIGLVHGLAGSGTLVILVMTQIKTIMNSLLYLVLFGFGSIIGMMLVAGIFSIPFSKKLIGSKRLRATLVITSSVLCFVYGCYVIYNNLIV
jgi:cytochrome c biogenesis protein CcdA